MKTRRNKRHQHVYICFWGLTRSLKYTLDSIKSVLEKFPKRTVFLHTYELESSYTNVRAKEIDVTLDKDEWKLLNPDYHVIDSQDEISKRLNFSEYRNSGDPWDNDFKSLDNFILGMYSLKRVTELLFSKVENPRRVIFMRPDVKFLRSPTESMLNLVDKNSIVVPRFHSWSYSDGRTRPTGGVNDRFAICSKNSALIYGTRVNSLLEYSKTKPAHSETFLRDLLDENGITVIKRDICFHRVRATGEELADC